MDNLHRYKSSAELKAYAKEHMFDQYGTAISAFLIVNVITIFVTFFSTLFLNTQTITGVVLQYLISFVISVLTGLFTSGEKYLYLKICCGRPAMASDVFYGFKLFPNKAVSIQLYLSVWLYLGMLPMTICSYLVLQHPKNAVVMLIYSLAQILYMVVAVMISLIYAQVFFLFHDFPEYSVNELLSMSRKLMKGSKGRLFYLSVSFIPLLLLGLLSCGIAYLWLIPYMNATYTEFFLDLIRNSQTTGNAG
ncbi:MAG: DUF975 family protein [Muribaculaceae bacterium]|nr:DUF975 family protein [Muribaculaceae bacterium]